MVTYVFQTISGEMEITANFIDWQITRDRGDKITKNYEVPRMQLNMQALKTCCLGSHELKGHDHFWPHPPKNH